MQTDKRLLRSATKDQTDATRILKSETIINFLERPQVSSFSGPVPRIQNFEILQKSLLDSRDRARE